MVFTLVQSSSLALALFSLVVSAEQSPLSNNPFIPQQRPLHDRPDVSQPSEGTESAARNATIKLFPASTAGFRPNFSYGCRERDFNIITLDTEVCLSGDYYLSHNFLITEAPICADGKAPVMSYWHEQGCVGEPKYSSEKTGKGIPDYCLWGGFSPEEWSLRFHCSNAKAVNEGGHQIAVPPPAPEPLPYFGKEKEKEKDEPKALEEPTDGVVLTHLFPACNGHGRKRPMTVPVDRCLTIHGFGIQFKTPAVCANGTRAKWARFEDSKCGYGELSAHYGLKDIKDSDIGECLSTGAEDGGEKVSSMSFWCDGFGDVKKPDPNAPKEPEKPKPKAGSVSESACMVGRAPFFSHPKTDTCVDLKTSRMKIYSTGVCTNGTSALLAKYKEKSCGGFPATFMEVTEESGNLEKCLDFEGTKSFAFWCEGKGLTGIKPNPSLPPTNPRRSGGSIIMIVVLCVFAGVLLAMVGASAWFTTDISQRVIVCFFQSCCGILHADLDIGFVRTQRRRYCVVRFKLTYNANTFSVPFLDYSTSFVKLPAIEKAPLARSHT